MGTFTAWSFPSFFGAFFNYVKIDTGLFGRFIVSIIKSILDYIFKTIFDMICAIPSMSVTQILGAQLLDDPIYACFTAILYRCLAIRCIFWLCMYICPFPFFIRLLEKWQGRLFGW